MFISTIIPTVGRPSLSKAVHSVLAQEFRREDCEIIVVNDSGTVLSVEDWQRQPNVQVVSTNRLDRAVARNTGAAIARGRYLHFLDDDDFVYPDAFEAFWKATRNVSAAWFHGGFRMVTDGIRIADVFPEERGNCFVNLIAWEWLPLQASIVAADAFFALGGFATLESLGGGFEDVHLGRLIALRYEFVDVPHLVACIRVGDVGSTTNYVDMFVQNSRSREKLLDMPEAFERLVSSASSRPAHRAKWRGKVTYYYLASASRHFRNKRLFTAIRRLTHAVRALVTSGPLVFTAEFLKGASRPHHSRAWLAINGSRVEVFQETQWNNGR